MNGLISPAQLVSVGLCFVIELASAQGKAEVFNADKLESVYAASIYCVWVQPAASDSPVDINRTAHGTAFLVHSAGYFLTANHVIKSTANGKPIRGRGGSCDKLGSSLPFTVVKSDDQIDLALIKLMDAQPLNSPQVIPLLPTALAVSKDKQLFAFGYPPAEDGGVSSLTKQEGKITTYVAPGAKFRFNAAVTKGFSGGPVFNQDGYVVGITIDGRDDVEGFKGFVPANFAANLLSILGWATGR